ncbi:hypothetical protein C6A85_98300 [Mycobacterium sp. ITM-2017-0098]|nr:hypothetical protein C6A85_98300 [Mycobacterium sp. ITM-2017-0098]
MTSGGHAEDAPPWASDLVADSDAALQRLCAVIEQGAADPLPPLPRGTRPLSVPESEAAAETNAGIAEALKALSNAVVGASDLANARLRDILATVSDGTESRRGEAPGLGALIRRGQEVLQRPPRA